MERDIIDIITEKKFIQLTASEKTEMQEFCKTEEEFNQLKSVFASVNAMPIKNPTPNPQTKKDLDALFVQTYPKVAPIWYNSVLAVVIPKDKPFYRQPMLQVAAVALLLFLAVPMFKNTMITEPVQVAENKIDNSEEDIAESNSNSQAKVTEVKSEEELTEEEVSIGDDLVSSFSEDVQTAMQEEANSSVTRSIISNADAPAIVSFAEPDVRPAGNDSEDFMHPDGVFAGNGSAPTSTLSFSAAETEDLLDLLTVTF
ncbi:MAG TPA: hypothetical protein EYG86_00935 [Crocinitomicaceae bacterium]|nr:hypothetical protein [Crocinitomicaceae bacterium]